MVTLLFFRTPNHTHIPRICAAFDGDAGNTRQVQEGDIAVTVWIESDIPASHLAVVLRMHPGWSAAQVRSAIVNTAERGILKNFTNGALVTDVNIQGAGRENLLNAVNAKVALDPVSVSLGNASTWGVSIKYKYDDVI